MVIKLRICFSREILSLAVNSAPFSRLLELFFFTLINIFFYFIFKFNLILILT